MRPVSAAHLAASPPLFCAIAAMRFCSRTMTCRFSLMTSISSAFSKRVIASVAILLRRPSAAQVSPPSRERSRA